MLRVVVPGQVRVPIETNPLGHCAKSCICEPTSVEPEPHPAARSGTGTISAITQITHSLARKVFDDFEKKEKQTQNEKLIAVRETFDRYNLISALHSYLGTKDVNFKNLLPPLILLKPEEKEGLIKKLESLKFEINKNLAA